MRFHRILIAVLVLCFIVLGIRMFHIGNDIWIAFMLLAIVSSFLLVNDKANDEYISSAIIDGKSYPSGLLLLKEKHHKSYPSGMFGNTLKLIEKHNNQYKVPNDWQIDSNGDDFIVLREEEADAVDRYEEGMKIIERYDADIKYRPDVTDEVVSNDDDDLIW